MATMRSCREKFYEITDDTYYSMSNRLYFGLFYTAIADPITRWAFQRLIELEQKQPTYNYLYGGPK